MNEEEEECSSVTIYSVLFLISECLLLFLLAFFYLFFSYSLTDWLSSVSVPCKRGELVVRF